MSGFADFPGSEVRARLDHPVIDADAHMLEAEFAFEDFDDLDIRAADLPR